MSEFEYRIIEDNTIEITSCDDKNATGIVIPNMIDGYDVTRIGKRAFYGFDNLVSVTILEGVESIDAYAFSFSSYLKEVHLPNSLKEVAENAFYKCNINDSGPVFIVEKGTFAYEYALEHAKRNNGKIKLSQNYIIKDHIMYDKDMREVIYCPNDIADLIDDYVVSIIIPEGVETIGCSAFSGCKALEEIHLPKSLKEIKSYAFANCESIETITIPNNVSNIGKGAFKECIHLEDVELPKELTMIKDYTFTECVSLYSINIPENVEYIGTNTFEDCTNLSKINLPSGLKIIGESAFFNTGLESIVIPESVETIENDAFRDCFFPDKVYIPKNYDDIMFYDGSFDSNTKIYYDDTCDTYESFYYDIWEKRRYYHIMYLIRPKI